MNKHDNILGIVLLIFTFIYIYLAQQLPQNIRLYPMVIAIIMIALTLIMLIQNFITKSANNDDESIFEGFQAKQFFFILALSLAYIFVIKILGFYVSTFIYLITCLMGLRVKALHAVLTSVGFCIVIYGVFTMFLRVPLPKGFII